MGPAVLAAVTALLIGPVLYPDRLQNEVLLLNCGPIYVKQDRCAPVFIEDHIGLDGPMDRPGYSAFILRAGPHYKSNLTATGRSFSYYLWRDGRIFLVINRRDGFPRKRSLSNTGEVRPANIEIGWTHFGCPTTGGEWQQLGFKGNAGRGDRSDICRGHLKEGGGASFGPHKQSDLWLGAGLEPSALLIDSDGDRASRQNRLISGDGGVDDQDDQADDSNRQRRLIVSISGSVLGLLLAIWGLLGLLRPAAHSWRYVAKHACGLGLGYILSGTCGLVALLIAIPIP